MKYKCSKHIVENRGTQRRSSETLHYVGKAGERYVVNRDTHEYVDHSGRVGILDGRQAMALRSCSLIIDHYMQ